MITRSSSFPRRVASAKHTAFTLIEVVVSSALMAIILVSAYLCLNAGVVSQKMIEPRVEIFQNARVALAILGADLRAACPLSTNYQFIGAQRMIGEIEADNLDFATHHYTPKRDGDGDFCAVSFFLDRNAESGQLSLWRRRNPMIGPDPFSGGSREEIAQGVLGLRLEYYDGFDWYNTWGDESGKAATSRRDQPNLTGIPEAVRITLLLDSNPGSKTAAETNAPPLVFQTVARLELADRPAGGVAAGATATGAPGNGAPPAGVPANGGAN